MASSHPADRRRWRRPTTSPSRRNHDGGPIATAAALHLAASLPNFFIQHIPLPADERDRRMRAELVSQPVETVRDGFAALPHGPGLGIEVNESALEKYKETAA